MIVLNFQGGIGNQMFIIAMCSVYKCKGKNAVLDNTHMDDYLRIHNYDNCLKLFNIDIGRASVSDVIRLSDKDKNIINKVRRKIFGLKKTYIVENSNGNFDEQILEMDNVYLDGYWQSYKYFQDYSEEIRRLFQFPEIRDKNKMFEELILKHENAISLHIRLGDYLEGINKEIYGDICTEEYYEKAIDYFSKKYSDCHFFVFSNDKEYMQRYLADNRFTIVDCNDEKTAWADMYLMTQCKHNIIANSSFSWWGAWLNQHEEKEVIAPKRWINTKEMKDICPSEWIRL